MFWLTKVSKLRNLRVWTITSSISVLSTPKRTENRPGTTLDVGAHSCPEKDTFLNRHQRSAQNTKC